MSIVIPVYNHASSVAKAIESAFEQDYRPLEVICVDGGSIDNTLETLQGIQPPADVEFQVIPMAHGGAAAARNRGLKTVSGEFIQFLDADDELLPDKITRQVALLAGNPKACMVAGGYRVMHPSLWNRGVQSSHGVEMPMDDEASIWSQLARSRLGITSANLFRREVVEAVDGWTVGRTSSQEYDLIFRMLKLGWQVVSDRTEGAIKNYTSDSIWNFSDPETSRRNFTAWLELRQQMMVYAEGNGLLSDDERKVLNERFYSIIHRFMPTRASRKFYRQALISDGWESSLSQRLECFWERWRDVVKNRIKTRKRSRGI
ncbi:MAG: glycosyltransferase family A protein [Myxococcota bacterium]